MLTSTEHIEIQVASALILVAGECPEQFQGLKKFFDENLSVCGPMVFQNETARAVFSAYSEGCDDVVAMLDHAGKAGHDPDTIYKYISTAFQWTAHWQEKGLDVQELMQETDKLLDVWEHRELVKIASECQTREEVNLRIESLPQRGQVKQVKQFWELALEAFDGRVEAVDLPADDLWPSHYWEIDEILDGGFRADYHLIAARPSMGKTALVLCLILAISRTTPCTLVSLETTELRLLYRLLSIAVRDSKGRQILKSSALKNPQEELKKPHYREGVEALQHKGYQIHIIDDSDLSLKEYLRRASGTVLFLDYLQLVDRLDDSPAKGKKEDSREREIASFSREVVKWTKREGMPAFILCQLNRSLERRPDKRPMMSDLRESGALEQDADVIMFLYRDIVYWQPDPKKPDEPPPDERDAELIFAKNRDGATGTVRLVWEAEFTTFKSRRKGVAAW